MNLTKERIDELIEEHFLSACSLNPTYAERHSREEMKEFWYKMVNNKHEHIKKDFENAITHFIYCNNNRIFDGHPNAFSRRSRA